MRLDMLNKRKIIGIVGNSGSGKSTFISYFKMNEKVGIINYETIKCNLVEEQLKYYVLKYKYKLNELESRFNEITKMLNIKSDILKRNIYDLSESELTKVLIGSVLLYNPEIIIVDELINDLDDINKEKIFKLFIKLKKFFNKTIIIVTSDIDSVYEFIDDVLLVDNGKVLFYNNKYNVYKNYDVLKSKKIRIPIIMNIIHDLEEKNVKIDNVDSINELIKAIYREMR